MSWGGPTWSQWYGATQEADQNHDIANHNYAAAQKWKAYAARIEKELDEVWALYKDARGNASGQRRLKNLAMDELTKIDPNNSVLDPKFREEEFDKAKAETIKQIKR